MALGFSDVDEQAEYDSLMYDSSCSIMGLSGDGADTLNQYEGVSILGVKNE